MTKLSIEPIDDHNRRLLANVHPDDWENPDPSERYNLVVVGAGSAGLITAGLAAGLGARVALIERHLLGGDCLNVGCVPSKGVIRASRLVAEARRAREMGLLSLTDDAPDFAKAMERMRENRARISDEDSARRYRDEFGVDVYLGDARFVGRDRVEVSGDILRFAKAVIATGARAAAPPIDGLEDAGYLTNETLFELTDRPRRLGVIGGGPIGCEMAQAFRRLGSEVVLFDMAPRVLAREDADASAIVQDALLRDGVQLELECQLELVEKRSDEKVVHIRSGEDRQELAVDEILVAVGRAPNIDGLGLEDAQVEFDSRRGVQVDDHLRTSNSRIFAAGDVCMDWKFTHAADAAAKIVVQNALFYPTKKLSDLVMPWCTYTDPEVAHVGLSETAAEADGVAIDTFKVPLSDVNRAVLDGESDGFVKLHTKQGSDQILGATIVAAHAGEMITQLTLAMVGKLGLSTLLNTIHPYPTQGEGIKRAAGLWVRGRMTPLVKKLLGTWMGLRR